MKRPHPTQQEIAERAYFIYLERGGSDGHHFRDWFEAEKELAEMHPAGKAQKSASNESATPSTSAKRSGPMTSHAVAQQS
jgi:hypothetical protein